MIEETQKDAQKEEAPNSGYYIKQPVLKKKRIF